MTAKQRFRGTVLLLAVIGLIGPTQANAAEIVIGTGSRAGVYFQVGRAICRLLDDAAPAGRPVCEAQSTPGSIYNLAHVRDGSLQLGVAQSDWQFHAVAGDGPFKAAGADASLRALFSVHSEPFTVVARRDAAITRFADLKGKRVNVGNPGSGQRATMEVVMQAEGWTMDDFSLANDLPASQQSLALCHDRVQAMIYTVGHPNGSVRQAVNLCDAVLVTVKDPAVDRLVAEHPYYAYTRIPGGLYPGNPQPVVTFGVKATVVASASLDPEVAYRIVSTVFDRLGEFKVLHPAFAHLDPAAMVRDGLSAPLHDGALRYFKEKGLL